jgi:hypothetical protein
MPIIQNNLVIKGFYTDSKHNNIYDREERSDSVAIFEY